MIPKTTEHFLFSEAASSFDRFRVLVVVHLWSFSLGLSDYIHFSLTVMTRRKKDFHLNQQSIISQVVFGFTFVSHLVRVAYIFQPLKYFPWLWDVLHRLTGQHPIVLRVNLAFDNHLHRAMLQFIVLNLYPWSSAYFGPLIKTTPFLNLFKQSLNNMRP